MSSVKPETTEKYIPSDSKNSTHKDEIPIQNIYYMLSYAYKNLKINKDVLKDSQKFTNIFDLFARILVGAINSLVRRGFYKEYIIKNEDTSNIKGKINFTNSIRRRTAIYKKLNCQYDEFSSDVLFNQIIKTTMDNLIRIDDLDNDLKRNLKKLRPFFYDVNTVTLNKQVFKTLMWNKNNQHYNLIINICELVFLWRLPKDNENGKIHFKDFIKKHEKEMANLFENFVFNFYKKEFEESKKFKGFKVSKPKIDWNLDKYDEEEGRDYLPSMRTDIVLEYNNKQFIIDTKFYKKILSSFHKKTMLHSPNLYQIYTYVNNSNFDGDIRGMLLYAALKDKKSKNIDYKYKIQNKIIQVKTLDLNQDWEIIDKDLRRIANILINNT